MYRLKAINSLNFCPLTISKVQKLIASAWIKIDVCYSVTHNQLFLNKVCP